MRRSWNCCPTMKSQHCYCSLRCRPSQLQTPRMLSSRGTVNVRNELGRIVRCSVCLQYSLPGHAHQPPQRAQGAIGYFAADRAGCWSWPPGVALSLACASCALTASAPQNKILRRLRLGSGQHGPCSRANIESRELVLWTSVERLPPAFKKAAICTCLLGSDMALSHWDWGWSRCNRFSCRLRSQALRQGPPNSASRLRRVAICLHRAAKLLGGSQACKSGQAALGLVSGRTG
jgi:hypothetical protein